MNNISKAHAYLIAYKKYTKQETKEVLALLDKVNKQHVEKSAKNRHVDNDMM